MVALLSVLPEQSLLQHTISTEKFPISKRCRFLPGRHSVTPLSIFFGIPLDILSQQFHCPGRSRASIRNRSLGAGAFTESTMLLQLFQRCCARYCRIPMQSFKSFINTLLPEKGCQQKIETPRCPPIPPRHPCFAWPLPEPGLLFVVQLSSPDMWSKESFRASVSKASASASHRVRRFSVIRDTISKTRDA